MKTTQFCQLNGAKNSDGSDGYAVLECTGADAAQFLHNQTTQDFVLLPPIFGANGEALTALAEDAGAAKPQGQARFGAYCSAKGRVLATFLGLKLQPDRLLLIVRQDAAEGLAKRLRMFVMRSKVTITDVTDQWRLDGMNLAQDSASSAALQPWQVSVNAPKNSHSPMFIGLHGESGLQRALRLTPVDTQAPENTNNAAHAAESPMTQGDWAQQDIRSGVAWVGAALADQFVPQMLNYERLEGINFKKGCYPGQEVVARAQYRGTVKRRLFALQKAEGEFAVGESVWAYEESSTESGAETESAGEVIQAQGNLALAILSTEAAQRLVRGENGLKILESPRAS